MNKDQREIQRKLRILKHAEDIGSVVKTCRYFGIGRSSFYRWREVYAKHGETGLINRPSIPKQHYNRTPLEIEEKVLYLRRKYHLGPIRIVWYLQRIAKPCINNVIKWKTPLPNSRIGGALQPDMTDVPTSSLPLSQSLQSLSFG